MKHLSIEYWNSIAPYQQLAILVLLKKSLKAATYQTDSVVYAHCSLLNDCIYWSTDDNQDYDIIVYSNGEIYLWINYDAPMNTIIQMGEDFGELAHDKCFKKVQEDVPGIYKGEEAYSYYNDKATLTSRKGLVYYQNDPFNNFSRHVPNIRIEGLEGISWRNLLLTYSKRIEESLAIPEGTNLINYVNSKKWSFYQKPYFNENFWKF